MRQKLVKRRRSPLYSERFHEFSWIRRIYVLRTKVRFPTSRMRLSQHYGHFWELLSRNDIRQTSISGTSNWKIWKNNGKAVISTFKDCHNNNTFIFFWFFTCWYVKLRFFLNSIWTKISQNGHSGRRLGLFFSAGVLLHRFSF